MKTLLICVVLVVAIVVGIDIAKSSDLTSSDLDGRLMVRLYVFNDKTQLWDRAREETVKNIQCDKLRGAGLPSGDEYNIERQYNNKK